jgi:hypothetical protein
LRLLRLYLDFGVGPGIASISVQTWISSFRLDLGFGMTLGLVCWDFCVRIWISGSGPELHR